jgi:hypothetical protein
MKVGYGVKFFGGKVGMPRRPPTEEELKAFVGNGHYYCVNDHLYCDFCGAWTFDDW